MSRATDSYGNPVEGPKRSVTTSKGRVVYSRKKNELRSRDVLRMANKLQYPVYVKDCDAQWQLLAVALRLTENLMPSDMVFIMSTTTQRQVWAAMRAWVARHPICIGMKDSVPGATHDPWLGDDRPWWQKLLKPFHIE